MKKLSCFATLAVAFVSFGAFAAVEDDQVRGELVSVDADDRTIVVRVTETGDTRRARVGSTQSFNVPADTNIEYQFEGALYERHSDIDIDELSVGDRVLLDFEDMQDTRRATNLRNERTNNAAVRDRIRRESRVVRRDADMDRDNMDRDNMVADNRSANRSRLPSSASVLPLLAIFGVMFAAVGGALRRFK